MTPREGIRWSVVTPTALRPKGVARAILEVERLHTLVADEAEALTAATSALTEAEQADVQALASAFRSGSTAKSQAPQVEKLRANLRERERRVEAAREALSTAEAEVGTELVAAREQWLDSAQTQIEKERAQCRSRLDELGVGLETLATLRGVVRWLSGDDLTTGARTRGLGAAPGSARFMANGEPVFGTTILDWARELVDPPARATPVEHKAIAGPPAGAGFTARTDVPVEAA